MNLAEMLNLEVLSQAPVRISFAGGGTDVSPYPEQYGGSVINATISTFMTARLRLRQDKQVIIRANTRPEPMVYPDVEHLEFDGRLDFVKAIAKSIYKLPMGFELYMYSSLPMRSGLGGSGAMCVAILGVFNHLLGSHRLNSYALAELAFDIETRQLKNASGRQDQYAAAFGGINHFEFLGNHHVRVNSIDLMTSSIRHLNQALVLVWLGQRQASGEIIQKQTDGVQNGGAVLDAMHNTKKYVEQMREAIERSDIHRIGELIDICWQEKKNFCEHISNTRIDDIYDNLRKAGMIGGKITGAGGGGHMLICCDIENRDNVIAAAEEMNIRVVPFAFVHEGLLTWQAQVRQIRSGQDAAATGMYIPLLKMPAQFPPVYPNA